MSRIPAAEFVGDVPKSETYDIAVIGAGSGGLTVASVAAQLGSSVALIEAHLMGGDCLNFGCVPSKALLRCAHLAQSIRESSQFGITVSGLNIEYSRVRDYVQDRIAALEHHDSAERFRSLGCDVIAGKARFAGAQTLSITTNVGNEYTLKARRVVIATGSSPKIPDIPGLREAGYLTNMDVFSHHAFPRRIAVIGGGPIGVELAQAFANLGSEVTMFQRGPRILPKDDAELAFDLQRVLESQGVVVHTETVPSSVESIGNTKRVSFVLDGTKQSIEVDEILIAAGRTPNTDLNLEAANVKVGTAGVIVDKQMRTTNKLIYACGDVVGPFLFTHMAGYQAGIVIANLLFKYPRKAKDDAVPWCTFTEPELAHVGMTALQAVERGIRHSVHVVDLADCDRAVCDSTHGKIKIVVGSDGKLLGAQILSNRAGEMIHEFAMVIAGKLKLATIRDTIHCYPTYSDAIRKVVAEVYRPKLFAPRTRTVVRWLRKFFG